MLLEILFRDEELCALLALVELTALLGWKFEQVFICRKRFLFQPELFLEHSVLCLLPLDCISDLRCLFIGLLVMEIERFRQRFKIILSVDEVFDTHLTQSEQFNEVGVT